MLELGTTQAKTGSEHIRDADTGNFEEAVLQASLKKPVIVDFWAPWCGPCKQMMPHLEKAVAAAGGAVSLVKINVDKYPELAEVFRVQSVPTVYAFFQGQPVDGFMGAKGESEIKAFIDKLVKQAGAAIPAEQKAEALNAETIAKLMADAAKFFAEGKYTDAMAMYSNVLDADEKNMEALSGIGWCFVAEKDMESLTEFVNQMTPEQKNFPRIKGLEFLLSTGKSAPEGDLSGKIEKNPKDLQSRYDFALQRIAVCDLESAIDALVDTVKRNREWEDQKARKLLLELFDALGNAHPLTSQGRRKLSAVLFS